MLLSVREKHGPWGWCSWGGWGNVSTERRISYTYTLMAVWVHDSFGRSSDAFCVGSISACVCVYFVSERKKEYTILPNWMQKRACDWKLHEWLAGYLILLLPNWMLREKGRRSQWGCGNRVRWTICHHWHVALRVCMTDCPFLATSIHRIVRRRTALEIRDNCINLSWGFWHLHWPPL